MNPEDELGQILLVGFEGVRLTDGLKRHFGGLRPAGVILFSRNYESPEQLLRLTRDLEDWAAGEGLPGPFLVTVDHEGGRVQRWRKPFSPLPAAREVALAGDPALAAKIGTIAGKELAAVGVVINFAPVLDVLSCGENRVIGDRSYGGETHEVSALGLAFLRAMEEAGVLGVAKHFPGHGSTHFDSHAELNTAPRTLRELEELDLPPFDAAIGAGVSAVMPAHVIYPALDPSSPASLSTRVLRTLLRGKLGFQGAIVSDDMVMGAIANSLGVPEGSVQAVSAGVDLLLVSRGGDAQQQTLARIRAALATESLERDRVRDAVGRVLALKQKVARLRAVREAVSLHEVGAKRHLEVVEEIRRRAAEALRP